MGLGEAGNYLLFFPRNTMSWESLMLSGSQCSFGWFGRASGQVHHTHTEGTHGAARPSIKGSVFQCFKPALLLMRQLSPAPASVPVCGVFTQV